MLDAVLAHRRKANPKPGPALYALRALALALAENTAIAGRLVGNRIVHPRAIDIGFAVEVDDGVLVPVMREVDKKPLGTLVGHLQRTRRAGPRPPPAERRQPARHRHRHQLRHLRPRLGHAHPAAGAEPRARPRRRPQGPDLERGSASFIPVTEAELTLSFDHRVLDGGGAGRLLGARRAVAAEAGGVVSRDMTQLV